MVVSIVVACALVGATAATAASAKTKLKVTTTGQKQILKKGGLEVKVTGLDKGKLKLKGNLQIIVRNVKAAQALVICSTRVPSNFLDE